MDIRKTLALRGPNIWANFPVLEAWIDLGEHRTTSTSDVEGFADRLLTALPKLGEAVFAGEQATFAQRLQHGLNVAQVMECVMLHLQCLAGQPVNFGRTTQTSDPAVYKVAVEYIDEQVGRATLDVAKDLVSLTLLGLPYDAQAAVAKLRDLIHDVCLGPSTASIVRAATKRGVPYRRLNTGSLVQFGHGCKQRRILTAETDRTSAIAESVAQDKQLTRMLLKQVGVPVPEGEPVSSAEEAIEVAEDIGYPVVVKPQFGNHGRGVATNLQTREQVLAAYAAAIQEEDTIVVEKYAPGDDYRILVIGNRVVAAAKREPAKVIGDGVSTIMQLIEQVNKDPRRSDGHSTVLSQIKIDAVALNVLADQNLTPGSIPGAGQTVFIRRNANLSTGGTATDVTDLMHPNMAEQMIDAARVIGLDIAGVDVVCQDISRPLEEQHGVVVEVNAGPGLRMHLEPSAGKGRAVGEAIIDMMFATDEDARIPIVTVTGTNGKTTTTRMIANILSSSGKLVGFTCTDGIYIGNRRVDTGDCSGPKSATAVLMNPRVEAAVFETARGGILREGLAFDRCDVAVVTNIGEGDHLGIADIDTVEKLAHVKATVVRAVAATGSAVLNADDPLVAAMASECPGAIVYYAMHGETALLQQRRAEGGRVVFVRDNAIILAEGVHEFPLISLDRIPVTHAGRVGFQVYNVLAATAATWALGTPAEVIRVGLEAFSATMDKAPGRFNLLEVNGATVVVDYGHNPSALSAMLDALQHFPQERRIVVYSAAGDRRDVDIIRQGELLGQHFDEVILYEDQYMRGRNAGEISALFRQGIDAAGHRAKVVHEVQGWNNAAALAVKSLRPGDLVLIQADVVDESVNFVRELLAAGNLQAREIDPRTPDDKSRTRR
jgi:cyanophycin synthetase